MSSSKTKNKSLFTKCESIDRDVHTESGQYLGTAPTERHARLWARSPLLLKLIKKIAEGAVPSAEEVSSALQGIED